MKRIISILFALTASLSLATVYAQEDWRAVITDNEGYVTLIPVSGISDITFEKETIEIPEPIHTSPLDSCYNYWNDMAPTSTGGIMDHMNIGFAGIMLLSDAMSNDISLLLGIQDPWRYDHVLEYNAQEYVRTIGVWKFFYKAIENANNIIKTIGETNEASKDTLGQAYAFRGISHAYLAQFYQKTYADSKEKPCVPIRLSSKDTSIPGRATVEEVYALAEEDLLKAIDYLDGYQRANKTFIDKSVAQGLLSRVYLVMNKWQEAAAMARAARQSYRLMTAAQAAEYNYQEIDNVETMWGLDVTAENTKVYASYASWMSADGYGYGGQVGCFHLIDAKLYQAIAGQNDARYSLFVAPGETARAVDGWEIPSYANTKFKYVADWLGDVIYMRTAEMYLTEAEALARSGNEAAANEVMKEFMNNRITNYTHQTMTADDIYTQRRLELWGEGFGYFDCCRLRQDLVRNYEGTNETADLQVYIPYTSYAWTYQIPLSVMDNDEHISEEDQNPLK